MFKYFCLIEKTAVRTITLNINWYVSPWREGLHYVQQRKQGASPHVDWFRDDETDSKAVGVKKTKKDGTQHTSPQGRRDDPVRLPCLQVWSARRRCLTLGCFPLHCLCPIPSPCPRLPPPPQAPPPLPVTAGSQGRGQERPACTWWPDRAAPPQRPAAWWQEGKESFYIVAGPELQKQLLHCPNPPSDSLHWWHYLYNTFLLQANIKNPFIEKYVFLK